MEQKTDQTDITSRLLSWYNEHKRDLPWRATEDPYLVWLSEVILQQTRVAQGWNYYLRFVDRFPDVQSLAEAEEEEVLKLWQGLGYYTRARNLHAAAKQILHNFHGTFPSEYTHILSLKGVGKYTAAAISSIAFRAPYAVVDGNVFRVLSRLFAIETPIDTTGGKKIISELAQSLIHPVQPGTYNQAIMDFGSLVCTPSQPKCADCPLQVYCKAYDIKKVSLFPVTSRKVIIRKRYFNYFHIIQGSHTFIQKRNESDIWKNLYEFPLVETTGAADFLQLSQTDEFKHLFPEGITLSVDHCHTVKHQLTHQAIHTTFYKVEVDAGSNFNPPEWIIRIEEKDLADYPVSRLTEKYLELI
ncbi:MAG: A/G-specific adenine glycosylase [Proteiniphilum sp.]|jgi:A/G-specific adenine glycosylase|nr:A/G-specific adenine glycosylase [Proteiniphilum sp.]MDD2936936.1 A/G-specific adenine glycosylase [Proteiniphilum sp.]MDD3956168.1 A/G-specific adenine glycosylase [Proteiniphilum sp.]MDD4452497.1 A/G-specific adenine glycosylase [Proteiniphilum sp.]NCB24804.1 A/G-specific adenine glycosylase [Bacteroidia bacterium]